MGGGTVTCADPSKGSNAGLGFRVHPGRLYRPGSTPSASNAWIYEDGAGGSHRFVAKVHADDGATDVGQCFTRDNSRLRLRIPGASNCTTNPTSVLTADVEFGNGVIHRFTRTVGTGQFLLTKILDRFGNEVSITRPTSGQDRWVFDDGYRTHTVYFETRAASGQRVVDRIVTAAFGGTTAEYDFSYVDTSIARNCKDEYHASGARVTVSLLSSLELPDGTSYSTGGSAGYETECAGAPDKPGAIKKLTLPTGGALEWTWQNVGFLASEAHGMMNNGVGVSKKRVLRSDGLCYGVANPPANNWTACEWTYTWASTGTNSVERKITVRDPSGDETVHWFDQKPTRTGSGASASGWEYGLPIRRSATDPTGGGRFLSREVYDGTAATGTKHQTVYVAFGHDTLFAPVAGQPEDWYDSNRRMTSERVLWNSVAGSAEHWAITTWSGDDGLGNFRNQALSGSANFGTSKTTFTNFNEGRNYPGGFTPPGVNSPWLLGTYKTVDVSEGGDTSRRSFVFDSTTGFLQCMRTHEVGTTIGENDVLVTYTPTSDGKGNVDKEKRFGGDRQTLLLDGTCDDFDQLSPEVETSFTYSNGVRASAQITGMTWKSLDVDIDANTGLVKTSRDTTGLATDFTYDGMGRLTRAEPKTLHSLPKDAFTRYVWDTTSTPISVRIDRCAPDVGCTDANRLTSDKITFDVMGRVWREEKRYSGNLTASALWNYRSTLYDPQGRKRRVSSTVAGSPGTLPNDESVAATVYSGYDPFGRPTLVTLPDGSQTKFSYHGAQWTKTEQKVALTLGGGEDWVVRWHGRDRLGRLFEVEEFSRQAAPTDDVRILYEYDEADNLTEVCMDYTTTPTPTCAQTRTFSYDNRGFLLSEFHPEKGAENSGGGTVSYSQHDSRGLAKYRDDGAATRRLEFSHDAAGRLLWIKETVGQQEHFWKEFEYATANVTTPGSVSLERGKLKTAKRLNRVAAPLGSTQNPANVRVVETYTYGGRAGRASNRSTTVKVNAVDQETWTFSAVYNTLGDVSTLNYPRCTGGWCGSGTGTPVRSVSFGYDNGLLSTITNWTTSAQTIGYHPNLQTASVPHANGMVETIANDANGMLRPASITVSGVTTTWETGAISYDGSGNIKQMGVSPNWDRFKYDRVSRLVEADLGADVATPNQKYTFDVYGNLTNINTGGTGVNYLVEGNTNRLIIGDYDAGGNMTEWNLNLYGYDPLNMMSTMNTGTESWAYVYTADDERLWALRTDGGKEIWTVRDFGARLLTRDEQDPNTLQGATGADFLALCTQANPIFCNGFETGNTGGWDITVQGRDVTDYIWRGDKAFASLSVTGGGSRHFALDHLGTVRLISSDIGAETLSRPTYYPFGQEVTTTTQTEVPLKFTGHERDSFATASVVDDLDYMKARFHSPVAGRFLSIDRIPGKGARPQSWNRYSYAYGNPMKFVDADGKEALVFIVGPSPTDQKGKFGHSAAFVASGGRSAGISYGGNRGFENGVRGFISGYTAEGRTVKMFVLNTTPEQDLKMIDFLAKNPTGGVNRGGFGADLMVRQNCTTAVCNTLRAGGVLGARDDASGALSMLHAPAELKESLESGGLSTKVRAEVEFEADPAQEDETGEMDQHGRVFGGGAVQCTRGMAGNKAANYCG